MRGDDGGWDTVIGGTGQGGNEGGRVYVVREEGRVEEWVEAAVGRKL